MYKALLGGFTMLALVTLSTPVSAAPRAGEVIKVTNQTGQCIFVVIDGHDGLEIEQKVMPPGNVQYFLNRNDDVKPEARIQVHTGPYCGKPAPRPSFFVVHPTAAKRDIFVFKNRYEEYDAEAR